MIDTEDVDGSTANPPAGWHYEPADHSVGLNGGWWHEECPLWPDGTDLYALFPVMTVDPLGPLDAEIRGTYLTRLTCECGASVVVVER